MTEALALGEDQEYPMEVGESRPQEAHPLPQSNGPSKTGTLSRKMRRKHLKAHACSSLISSQTHIPNHVAKDQESGKGKGHCRAPAPSPAESAQKTATKNYLTNIKITKIQTSV